MLYKRDFIDQRIKSVIRTSESCIGEGKVASYIPELANVNPDNFALSITSVTGESFNYGNYDYDFSIQSICKVLLLIMALHDNDPEAVYNKVGSEPTKYEFNSLVPITDKASNPFINAGAITTASMILGNSVDDRNKAIAYYLKSKEIFDDDPEMVLDLYIRACSISTNVVGLSRMGAVLANKGFEIDSHYNLLSKSEVQIVLSQMATCGMYEKSGRYLMNVGIPSKSGVSGGILGVVPGVCGIGVYSPRLDETGNSVRGKEIFNMLGQELDLSIFIH